MQKEIPTCNNSALTDGDSPIWESFVSKIAFSTFSQSLSSNLGQTSIGVVWVVVAAFWSGDRGQLWSDFSMKLTDFSNSDLSPEPG